VDEPLPQPGSVTAQMKVLDQQHSARSLTVRLSAPAGSSQTIFLRINGPRLLSGHAHLRATGVDLPGKMAPLQNLNVTFASTRPASGGSYVEKVITFRW
jgi:hypothetical protein